MFWVGVVKNECGQSGYGTLKLTGFQANFLNAGTNSGKLKVASMIFGWAWLKMDMTF